MPVMGICKMSVRSFAFAIASLGSICASAANAETLPVAASRAILGNYMAGTDGPVIAIAACGQDRICGRIVGLGKLPATDTQNPDAGLKARALCGLEVLTADKTGDSMVDRRLWQGKLYHAERGTSYFVTVHLLEKGDLTVRGNTHVMGMTRSFQFMQTWQRTTASYVACTAPAS